MRRRTISSKVDGGDDDNGEISEVVTGLVMERFEGALEESRRRSRSRSRQRTPISALFCVWDERRHQQQALRGLREPPICVKAAEAARMGGGVGEIDHPSPPPCNNCYFSSSSSLLLFEGEEEEEDTCSRPLPGLTYLLDPGRPATHMDCTNEKAGDDDDEKKTEGDETKAAKEVSRGGKAMEEEGNFEPLKIVEEEDDDVAKTVNRDLSLARRRWKVAIAKVRNQLAEEQRMKENNIIVMDNDDDVSALKIVENGDHNKAVMGSKRRSRADARWGKVMRKLGEEKAAVVKRTRERSQEIRKKSAKMGTEIKERLLRDEEAAAKKAKEIKAKAAEAVKSRSQSTSRALAVKSRELADRAARTKRASSQEDPGRNSKGGREATKEMLGRMRERSRNKGGWSVCVLQGRD